MFIIYNFSNCLQNGLFYGIEDENLRKELPRLWWYDTVAFINVLFSNELWRQKLHGLLSRRQIKCLSNIFVMFTTNKYQCPTLLTVGSLHIGPVMWKCFPYPGASFSSCCCRLVRLYHLRKIVLPVTSYSFCPLTSEERHRLMAPGNRLFCSVITSAYPNYFYPMIYRWLRARLQFLQCVSNGGTAVLHKAINM